MRSRLLSAFIVLVALVGAAHAQITITEADARAMLNVGRTITSDSVTMIMPVTVGSPSSSAQTFDFSMFTFVPSSTATIVNAAGTPMIDSFPGAQFAMFTTAPTGTIYSYFSLTSQALLSYGIAASTTTGPMVLRMSPPEPQMKFPLTYGTTWTYNSDSTEVTGGMKMVTNTTRTVDAFGTLKLPGGVSKSCLRMKTVSSRSIVMILPPPLPPMVVQSTKSYDYEFQMKDGMGISVGIDSASQSQSTVTPTSISYSEPGGSSSVDENTLPAGLDIVQNYPNPFHGTTTVDYTLSTNALVRIDVLNMLGQVVGTIYSGTQNAGRYGVALNAQNLPAGRYNCRIAVNGHAANHFMTVVK